MQTFFNFLLSLSTYIVLVALGITNPLISKEPVVFIVCLSIVKFVRFNLNIEKLKSNSIIVKFASKNLTLKLSLKNPDKSLEFPTNIVRLIVDVFTNFSLPIRLSIASSIPSLSMSFSEALRMVILKIEESLRNPSEAIASKTYSPLSFVVVFHSKTLKLFENFETFIEKNSSSSFWSEAERFIIILPVSFIVMLLIGSKIGFLFIFTTSFLALLLSFCSSTKSFKSAIAVISKSEKFANRS